MKKAMVLVLSVMLLNGCATVPPKVGLAPEQKKSIKRIALIEMPNQEKFFNEPGALPGGFMLLMFGAIGGGVLGGIEATRFENATNKFTEALAPHKLKINSDFTDAIHKGLKERGYDVTLIKPLPLKTDGKTPDYSQVKEDVDAIFSASVMAGYGPEQGMYHPKINSNIKLLSRNGEPVIYQNYFSYGHKLNDTWEYLPADTRFIMKDHDEVFTKPTIAAEAFQDGILKIADRTLKDFDK